MVLILTLKDKCRKCYTCVRNCPVKAIKGETNHTEIIYERCIACGKCVNNCPQKAKIFNDKVATMERLLASGQLVVAVLGGAFPAFFHNVSPGQLVAGLKELGFAEVHEGAYGVELVAVEYVSAIEVATTPLISSHCPAIVDLIERHYPKLINNLIEVVSPMVAIGRFLKGVLGAEVKVVYISSCIGAKLEIESEEIRGAIDVVLTCRELDSMFKSHSIDITSLEEESFDGIQPYLGRLFPITEGSFRVLPIVSDLLDGKIVTATGEVNVMEIISDLAQGRITPQIADIRFCYNGCIGGPGMNNDLTSFFKRNLVISHFKSEVPYKTAAHYLDMKITPHLARSFSNRYVKLKPPKSADITKILNSTNKYTQKDELNCSACGYRTCREYSVAVHQGLANLEMCLPYNFQQLEEDRGRLIQKYELAQRELNREYGDEFIIGTDKKTQEVLDLIKQVGPTPTTVLIRGESGTGKELIARAIHRYSKKNDKPLVTVNCTTITDSLLESELFGHRKGAFTGADADKIGLFEAADGGTIFLDEIGDITSKLQAELLRVLDSGDVRPVGGTATKKVDIRLIAATNKNLEEGIKKGWFREDLYYRLNVFTITTPPLRSRVESIPILAQHFLEKASAKLNKKIVSIEMRAIKAMMDYPWSGNIREMQNVIERAAVLTQDDTIRLEHLPHSFVDNYTEGSNDRSVTQASFQASRERHVGKVEKDLIQQYLTQVNGHVSKAAKLADIPRRSFYRLMKKYGLNGREIKARLKIKDSQIQLQNS
ncbi:MAG: sigma 54-interacting transcriptional regulator [Desulfuromonadaceae bacterium]|nr:sigma 54-interacting transcriptional regulator [Desulfuromonadaceae bacterium]